MKASNSAAAMSELDESASEESLSSNEREAGSPNRASNRYVDKLKLNLEFGIDSTDAAPVSSGKMVRLSTKERVSLNSIEFDDSPLATSPGSRKLMKGHAGAVTCVAYFLREDIPIAVSGGEEELINVWSLVTGGKIGSLQGHTAQVSALAAYSDELRPPLLISGSWDETVRIWPVEDFFDEDSSAPVNDLIEPMKVIEVRMRVFSIVMMEFIGSNPMFAVGGSHNQIKIYSLPSGVLQQVLDDQSEGSWTLCMYSYVIPDFGDTDKLQGMVLVCGCANKIVRVWHLPDSFMNGVMNAVTSESLLSKMSKMVSRGDLSDVDESSQHSRESGREGSSQRSAASNVGGMQVTPATFGLDGAGTLPDRSYLAKNGKSLSRTFHRRPDLRKKNSTSSVGSYAPLQKEVSITNHDSHSDLQELQSFKKPEFSRGVSNVSAVTDSSVQSLSGFKTAVKDSLKKKKARRTVSNQALPMKRNASERKLRRKGKFIRPAIQRTQVKKAQSRHMNLFMNMTRMRSTKKVDASWTRKPKLLLKHPSRVHSLVVYDCDEEVYIATLCKDTEIRVWTMNGDLAKILRGANSPLTWISVFDTTAEKGGGIIAAGTQQGDIRLWLHTTAELFRVFHGHSDEVSAMVMFPSPFVREQFVKSKSLKLQKETSVKSLESDFGKGRKRGRRSDDLMIISASRDSTLRTWIVNDEKSLKVLHHGEDVKITCMDVHIGTDTIIVTGAEDGKLRGWLVTHSNVKHSHTMVWSADAHLEKSVRALSIYCPNASIFRDPTSPYDKNSPPHLREPFVISTADDSKLKVTMVLDGEVYGEVDTGSSSRTTVLHVFNGSVHRKPNVDPFVLAAGEDKVIRMLSLRDFVCVHNFSGHYYAITSVSLYAPSDRTGVTFSNSSTSQYNFYDPIIVSGSVDNTVRLWSHNTGECIATLSDCNTHVTDVATLDLPQQPAVVASDADGSFFIWSLNAPFELLHTIPPFAQEVGIIATCDIEGRFPVLIGAHVDGTCTVWNLDSYELVTVLEGHTAQVTALRVFTKGGSISAVASASRDGTVRVIYDFLDTIPDASKIMNMFNSDRSGETTILANNKYKGRWPRIAEAVRRVTIEEFFSIYYYLFKYAVNGGRPDFLLEFLPHTRIGLVNSHNTALVGKSKDLLAIAIDVGSAGSVQTIVDCWIAFLAVPPSSDQDIFYDVNFAELAGTMDKLAEQYPSDYERLIVSIKPVKVRYNIVPARKHYLFYDKQKRKMSLSKVPESGPSEDDLFYFYPIPFFANTQTLMSFEAVCQQLDSVQIFNSEVGKMVLQYTWRTFGSHAHFYTMVFYMAFVLVASLDVLTFHIWFQTVKPLTLLLMAFQLGCDVAYIYLEGLQFLNEYLWYLMHIWNAVDMATFIFNALGVILRVSYRRDTVASKVALSISITCAWFNILQYLRAYEATGPLVAMILKIAADIKYLGVVLLVILLGFAQAFWLLSREDEDVIFNRIDKSLLYSFSFMLGSYEPAEFDTAELKGFLVALSVVYMLIVAILLLNLLIALMGNTYSNVQTKGLGQWRLERAQICVDMDSSTFARNHERIEMRQNDIIFIKKSAASEDFEHAHDAAGGEMDQTQLTKHLCDVQNAVRKELHKMREETENRMAAIEKQNRKMEKMLSEIAAIARGSSKGAMTGFASMYSINAEEKQQEAVKSPRISSPDPHSLSVSAKQLLSRSLSSRTRSRSSSRDSSVSSSDSDNNYEEEQKHVDVFSSPGIHSRPRSTVQMLIDLEEELRRRDAPTSTKSHSSARKSSMK